MKFEVSIKSFPRNICIYFKIYIYTYIYIYMHNYIYIYVEPQMTSIFEGQPSKRRPNLQWKQGSFGFQAYIYPRHSMYGIFTYIYHKNQPNVDKYTIHGKIATSLRLVSFSLGQNTTYRDSFHWKAQGVGRLSVAQVTFLSLKRKRISGKPKKEGGLVVPTPHFSGVSCWSSEKDQDSLVMFSVTTLHPTINNLRKSVLWASWCSQFLGCFFSSSFKEVASLTFLAFYENLTIFLGFV